MKVCIVGGTGNISSSIVKLLLEQNHEVTCYNRGKSGSVPKGVRVIIGDRRDQGDFEKKMKSEFFDAAIDMYCFNAKEASSSIRAFENVSHFIMCSTVCTYGVDFSSLPVTEEHSLKPIASYGQNKAEADAVFLEAHTKNKFPVTIIKPSTTYGPKSGLLRQVGSQDFSWIDRIRKGKPIIVCGDGNAIHQFLHVDDAAFVFVNILKKEHCIGQTYNLVNREYFTWADYHKLAMKILGRDCKLIGVPFNNLEKLKVPGFDLCREVFSHHAYFSSEKLYRDLPEFNSKINLEEGMKGVIDSLDKENRIANSNNQNWEDLIINKQNTVKRDLLMKINKLFFKVKKKLFIRKK